MPRAGLTPDAVVSAAADLADEVGWSDLTLARVAERVGVRAPSLYKHVASQGDLTRRIAVLALTQAGEVVGAAVRGRSGTQALGAAARALRGFVTSHPGRYGATLGVRVPPADSGDAQDPVAVAAAQGLEPLRAVLRGYDVAPEDEIHALRALRSVFHGFATLESAGGFQHPADVDESFEWLIALVDRGLRGTAPDAPRRQGHDRTSGDAASSSGRGPSGERSPERAAPLDLAVAEDGGRGHAEAVGGDG